MKYNHFLVNSGNHSVACYKVHTVSKYTRATVGHLGLSNP